MPNLSRTILPFAIILIWVFSAHVAADDDTHKIHDAYGRAIETIDAEGNVIGRQQLPQVQLPQGSGLTVIREGQHYAAVYHDDVTGLTIDATGNVITAAGEAGFEEASNGVSVPQTLFASNTAIVEAQNTASVGPITIDSMTLGDSFSRTYTAYNTINLLGRASNYMLSDGSSWRSGAGSSNDFGAFFDRVEVDGSTIRYFLRAQDVANRIFAHTDYNSGNHSSVGTLSAAGDLVLEAQIGSAEAVLRGHAEISENMPANALPPRFNYFSSVVGAVVPYELTYTLTSGTTWQLNTFDQTFSYRRSIGVVDFANPISLPAYVGLNIRGAVIAPSESLVEFFAVAQFENDTSRDVTSEAQWQISPSLSNISINQGVLTIGVLGSDNVNIDITASWEQDGVSFSTSKSLVLRNRSTLDDEAGHWPTFQGNRGHTGHVPIIVDSDVFGLRWQREVGDGVKLHQVAAGDDKVFVSVPSRFQDKSHLFALDARDGEELWSKGFGAASSVNPPALSYGTVYLQTGKGTSSGPRYPRLHALDANSGEEIFTSIIAAQWEEYFAPTAYDGDVYVNGGTYGGMYSFNAFTGELNWFSGLGQYDEWTPAVDEQNAYAYVGGTLSVVDRLTGETRYSLRDDSFTWRGYDMELAPVLGGMEDVLVIHNGRMARFDLEAKRKSWEVVSAFVGQPVVKDGVVYVTSGNAISAYNQATGVLLWRLPTTEALQGGILITNSHLFVSGTSQTFALDLLSRQLVWSYPHAGELALGNETLYIAGREGLLTAIAMPEYILAPPVGLEIIVAEELTEFSATELKARVSYADGRVRDRSTTTTWSITPGDVGTISEDGVLSIGELFSPAQNVVINASYEEDGVQLPASISRSITISVSISAFIKRNLEESKELQKAALPLIEEAYLRANAARDVLSSIKNGAQQGPPSERGAQRVLKELDKAILWEYLGKRHVNKSIDELEDAIKELETADEPEEEPKLSWWSDFLLRHFQWQG